ncbi:MAG: DNA-binding domain-containing protein [Hyphomicrobiales bacterium]
MPIKYAIFPNNLTSNPNDKVAVVQRPNTIDTEGLIDEMSFSGEVTKTQALGVLNEWKRTIMKKLSQGYNVHTDLIKYSLSISGPFENDEDHFIEGRNQVNINCSPNKKLKKVTNEIETQKVKGKRPSPSISKIVDTSSKKENESITEGMVAEIKGHLLKFNMEDEQQGVFFVEPDGTEHRCSSFIRNLPSTLICYIPKGITAETVKTIIRIKLNKEQSLREHISSIVLKVIKAE